MRNQVFNKMLDDSTLRNKIGNKTIKLFRNNIYSFGINRVSGKLKRSFSLITHRKNIKIINTARYATELKKEIFNDQNAVDNIVMKEIDIFMTKYLKSLHLKK